SHCLAQGDWTHRKMSDSIGRLLIFVNPNSGYMKGVKTFKEKVEPELRKKHIDYELIITEGVDHAKRLVETREDLANFNAILILSGDGLVFEVLNGLFNRRDHWELLHVLPIGIIPSGSGNGLLSSVFAARKYPLKNPSFTNKAIELATSATCLAQPVNLIHAQTRDSNYAAFLSIGWGLMADIDVESERWRKPLGSNRFVLGALIRCCNLRTYRGRLSYREHTLSDDVARSTFDVFGRTAAEKLRDCTCLKPGTSRRDRAESSTTRRNEDIWLTAHSIEGIPPSTSQSPRVDGLPSRTNSLQYTPWPVRTSLTTVRCNHGRCSMMRGSTYHSYASVIFPLVLVYSRCSSPSRRETTSRWTSSSGWTSHRSVSNLSLLEREESCWTERQSTPIPSR
ncbi:hypothetical protein PMAYCL1PPCAC_06181, partial [Pristionchus mayeri]